LKVHEKMPIAMMMKWTEITPEHYEKLRKTVNWEGNVPKGLQFHVASFNKEGMRVVDVWNSAEDFDNFTKSRLMPAVQQLGVKGEPQVEIYPTHAVFAPALKK
jgi:hypothetical protein